MAWTLWQPVAACESLSLWHGSRGPTGRLHHGGLGRAGGVEARMMRLIEFGDEASSFKITPMYSKFEHKVAQEHSDPRWPSYSCC